MTAVVSLYECGERRRESRRQDMLLSDTAPDAQKHDVISSPTDTFGVISSGAVSAVLLRHRTPWPTSPHRTGRPATLQSRSAPPKTRSGIVSSQLSALSTTLEQGPEIFEAFPHSASKSRMSHCAVGKGPRPGGHCNLRRCWTLFCRPRELRDRCIQTLQWKKGELQSVHCPAPCGGGPHRHGTLPRRWIFVGCSIAPLTARWPDSH